MSFAAIGYLAGRLWPYAVAFAVAALAWSCVGPWTPPKREDGTMKIALILAAVLLASHSPAHAAAAGYLSQPDGSRIVLHDEAGAVCVGQTLHAEYVAPNGAVVGGCWTMGGGMVAVVFFDGDTAKFPISMVERSKPS